jgi:hypothetical protein
MASFFCAAHFKLFNRAPTSGRPGKQNGGEATLAPMGQLESVADLCPELQVRLAGWQGAGQAHKRARFVNFSPFSMQLGALLCSPL